MVVAQKANFSQSPFQKVVLALFTCMLTSCFEPIYTCDCEWDRNITVKTIDGKSGACIDSLHIIVTNSTIHDSIDMFSYDSAKCDYHFSSGSGEPKILLKRNNYPDINISLGKIQYYEDDCCGTLDRKTYSISWFQLDTQKEPMIQ